MSSLIPGGMALITRSKNLENLGRMVRTVECLGADEWIETPNVRWHNPNKQTIWAVQALDGYPLTLTGSGLLMATIAINATSLTPIGNDGDEAYVPTGYTLMHGE